MSPRNETSTEEAVIQGAGSASCTNAKGCSNTGTSISNPTAWRSTAWSTAGTVHHGLLSRADRLVSPLIPGLELSVDDGLGPPEG